MLDTSQGVGLYTDGSNWRWDKSGGWAWLAVDAFDGEISSSGFVPGTTNNRMEMMAWIDGLLTLAEEYGPCHVLVYSDSEYVGLGVRDSARMRNANSDYWELLDMSVALHHLVEFHHVKGHSGNVLNERVDKMAKKARLEGRDNAGTE